MRFDNRTLLCGEPTWLTQDWSEHLVNLAHVVQKRGDSHAFQFSSGHTNRLRNDRGGVRDATRMSGGIWVASFDGSDHQLEQLLVRLLQLPVDRVQLTSSNDEGCECRGTGNSKVGVNLCEYEHEWQRQEIVGDCAQRVLLPHADDPPILTKCDYTAHRKGVDGRE